MRNASTRPLDVLYVGTLPPHHGGSAVMSAQLLDGLSARGHAVHAIAPITAAAATAGDRFADRAAYASFGRYLVPSFDTSPTAPPAADDFRAELEQVRAHAARLLNARRPDVVISGRESFAWTVSTLAARYELPWIQIVQGTTAVAIVEGTYPARAADDLLGRFGEADIVTTPARHAQAALERHGLSRIEVVPNPVDLSLFGPRPGSDELRRRLRIEPGAIVVAHVSNLKPLKRAGDLVAAADLLRETDLDLVYLVLGDGPERGSLEAAVAARRLGGDFRFVDWVDHELVPDYLNLADVVVMPSAGETQALVYLETQACARTLLASDIPAAREVAEDGESAVLFPVGDVGALAAAIAGLARNPGLRAEIGRNAAERVKRHSVESTVSAYEGLLGEAASVACRDRPV